MPCESERGTSAAPASARVTRPDCTPQPATARKLGLDPVEARLGGLFYRCGEGDFGVFESAGAVCMQRRPAR
jgi:hypothetical protein